MKKIALILFVSLMLFSSCNKDDDNETINTSRTLHYSLTGNFSGTNLIVSFTTANGGTSNEQINILPWDREITYNSNVTAANIAVSGNGGTAGQQVTLIIKRGNTVGTPTVATADASGSFTKAAPVVVF
ncbi:hypothetical protein [Epilithonimonas sp.]|uniref:hypothetical protein n=1 Tax=Epilithonimonas sp. TaxID=2894511 RepID=UPI0028AF819B|nr:hypothetical protein [Epilithonimonas sp.]